MKRRFLNLAAIAALGVLMCGTSNGQTSQIVDLYQHGPGLMSGAYDIGAGAAGSTLYAVGTSVTDSSGSSVGVVRRSDDGGANWYTEDVYSEEGWTDLQYRGFGEGRFGELYAAGELWRGEVNTGTKAWIVREKRDGVWSVIDRYITEEGGKPSCGDIKVNPSNGDIYAVGRTNSGSNSGFYWLVRKRAAGAEAFENVDLQGAAPISDARAVGFLPNGTVFVVGRIGNGQRDVWTVRRSTDNGVTWRTVDSFVDASQTYSEARCIAVSEGAVYVGGRAVQSSKGKLVNNWVVRRSLDGGSTWTTVDRYGAEPAPYGIGDAAVAGIAVDGDGRVYASGRTATGRFVIRRGVEGKKGSMTWATIDDQFVNGRPSEAQALTLNQNGDVFTAGLGQIDSSGLTAWVVRMLNIP